LSLLVQGPLVRAQVKVVLAGSVTNAAPVYDWLRNLTSGDAIASLATDNTGRFHFWMFGLSGAEPVSVTRLPGRLNRCVVQWEIHGYYAEQDLAASEKTFENEVAAVMDAFEGADAMRLKAGGVNLVTESGPAQRSTAGLVMIGSTLCNYARLSLPTVLHLGYQS
jgi:hypothetical protein